MLIANARPSTASGLAASSGLSVPRHTLASRCCLRHCRQRRYAAHRVRACQSVTGPHQAQGLAIVFCSPIGVLVKQSCTEVLSADSQPETPDSRSRRSLQVTFTCDKCGMVPIPFRPALSASFLTAAAAAPENLCMREA